MYLMYKKIALIISTLLDSRLAGCTNGQLVYCILSVCMGNKNPYCASVNSWVIELAPSVDQELLYICRSSHLG